MRLDINKSLQTYSTEYQILQEEQQCIPQGDADHIRILEASNEVLKQENSDLIDSLEISNQDLDSLRGSIKQYENIIHDLEDKVQKLQSEEATMKETLSIFLTHLPESSLSSIQSSLPPNCRKMLYNIHSVETEIKKKQPKPLLEKQPSYEKKRPNIVINFENSNRRRDSKEQHADQDLIATFDFPSQNLFSPTRQPQHHPLEHPIYYMPPSYIPDSPLNRNHSSPNLEHPLQFTPDKSPENHSSSSPVQSPTRDKHVHFTDSLC